MQRNGDEEDGQGHDSDRDLPAGTITQLRNTTQPISSLPYDRSVKLHI